MYKIYINETPLILISSEKLNKEIFPREEVLGFAYSGRKKTLLNYIDNLEKSNNYKAIVVHYSDLDRLFDDFLSLFRTVRAGGGLVTNKKNEILFIFRRGKWDLPKGKLDAGENFKIAAVREVKEECGLINVERKSKILTTYHVYRDKNQKRILKKTKWYHMLSDDKSLTPQKNEGIDIACWRSLGDFLNSRDVAYNNIMDVLLDYQTNFSNK